MTTLALADDYVVTRHGFLRRKYRATPELRSPHGCNQDRDTDHLTWSTGFINGRTLYLTACLCEHPAPVPPELPPLSGDQLTLW